MIIIAGLGNPGPKYEKNRHNIGFMAVDRIASRHGLLPVARPFSVGVTAEGSIAGVKTLLLLPGTYMNESGRSVAEAARFFKIELADIVAFHDELDLAPGKMRVKTGGGAAGQNGIRSLISHLGAEFRRGRMGVGHPGESHLVMPHVLGDFHKAEMAWLDPMLTAVADALPFAVAGEDERFQGEVLRLAPAPKFSPRQAAQGSKAD
jgi:PTH1 family peptidyl-tRNA hydrolase